MPNSDLPDGLIAYGPDANCTLKICPVEASVYEYRPSLGANGAFIAIFAVLMIIHIIQGIRWRTWAYMTAMILGCLDEIIGYIGRIMLHQNPFSFTGFLMQIICITTAAAFYAAAIYITLYQIIQYLGPEHSRLSPKLYYQAFIACDIVSLALQAAGGALSSTSSGSSKVGVDIALAGLSFQVFTLVVFTVLVIDFVLRFWRSSSRKTLSRSFKIFAFFMSLALIFIFIRCAYRIDELSDGYSGALIHDEGLFIALEGVMIVLAVVALNIAHPGPAFLSAATRQNENSIKTAEEGYPISESK